ncbi:MAG TPA: hypothetical protein V6D26_08645 [Stenomitos sp.]
MRIHLSSAGYRALQELAGMSLRRIAYCYEDTNLEAEEIAEELYAYLQEHSPEAYHLIDTGDDYFSHFVIHTKEEDLFFNTYNPHYYSVLVPASVWEKHHEEVVKIDRWFHQEATALVQGLAMRIEWGKYANDVERWWDDFVLTSQDLIARFRD